MTLFGSPADLDPSIYFVYYCDRLESQIRGHVHSDKRISAFATRFCVKFYATLLRSLCRVVTLRSHIGGVSRSERGFTALSQVSARPHGVAGALKINRKHGVEIVTSTGM